MALEDGRFGDDGKGPRARDRWFYETADPLPELLEPGYFDALLDREGTGKWLDPGETIFVYLTDAHGRRLGFAELIVLDVEREARRAVAVDVLWHKPAPSPAETVAAVAARANNTTRRAAVTGGAGS